jgi:hypothetical protein
MSDDRTLALTRAYELIEAGNPDEARAILESILDVEKNNADAWWIYAHAVDEPAAARDALENVLQLNPHYPGANELLDTLREQYPDLPPSAAQRRAAAAAASIDAPSETDAAWEDEPELPEDEIGESKEVAVSPVPSEGRSSVMPWLAAAAFAVIVVLVIVLIASSMGQTAETPAETPTAIADVPTLAEAGGVSVPTMESFGTLDASASTEEAPQPTAEATIEAVIIPEVTEAAAETGGEVQPDETEMAGMIEEVTAVPAEPEVTEAAQPTPESTLPEMTPEVTAPASSEPELQAIASALSGFALPDTVFRQQTTSLGETLVASVCTRPGLELRTDLIESLSSMARASESVDGVQAIAVEMVDCVNNTPLRLVGVALTETARFAQGELDDEAFQAVWRAL